MAQGIGPADIAGRTYSDVIASVQHGLTGDFKHDGALITSIAESCGGHPQAKEIRRELGRMLHAIAPDDVKAEFDQITDDFGSGFDPGLTEARAHIKAGDVAAARLVLEDLIRRYGTGTGLYLDDSVSEYRHFANDFELALYARLYRPTRVVRQLPQDRATLYSRYGAVLLELRDTHGAEEALLEALRVNPVSTDAMFELGEVLKLSGRKREFRELTLRALGVAYTLPALGRAYRNLGYLAIEEADYDLAVACYCSSAGFDGEHAQAAESELLYIQQVTGRTIALPEWETVQTSLAKNGIQVGPSQLVAELMDSTKGGQSDAKGSSGPQQVDDPKRAGRQEVDEPERQPQTDQTDSGAREERARATIHEWFTRDCQPKRDALLAASAIRHGTTMNGLIKEAAEHIGAAASASPATFVEECRAFTLARYARLWVNLIQMFGLPTHVEREATEYLQTFVPQLYAHLTSVPFLPLPGSDDVFAWGGALGVYGEIWIQGKRRGISTAELMASLWQST